MELKHYNGPHMEHVGANTYEVYSSINEEHFYFSIVVIHYLSRDVEWEEVRVCAVWNMTRQEFEDHLDHEETYLIEPEECPYTIITLDMCVQEKYYADLKELEDEI